MTWDVLSCVKSVEDDKPVNVISHFNYQFDTGGEPNTLYSITALPVGFRSLANQGGRNDK